MKNKIEVIEKFIISRLSGMMRSRELITLKAAVNNNAKEKAFDNMFNDYMVNLIEKQDDKNYWLNRYHN